MEGEKGYTELVKVLNSQECIKELITSEKISIADEFRIMNLILTCYPRSAELFSHRRWLIQHAAKIGDCDIKTLCKLELTVAAKTADQYYSNYISWSHRCWILCTYLANYQEILLSELQDTALWLQMHVSDSNVYYYRQQLLTLLVQLKRFLLANIPVNNEEKKNLCHQEMEFVNESCLVKESTDLTFGPNRQIHFAKEYKIFINFMISTLDNI
ncbi:uncharacterized protein TRIADDRAFT_54358 [Trichoplax adhaerens]|uniref:Protein prenyltransferase alpha subunit repeat-containing protein 1 n=1 Tax=Trichoplax adhaerens TaxID=10228 RepID=B3RRT4_TRIAD|nr:hypothetical protein TRIADDRAFT_54358 [Trichoplax adhaerens]EDV26406.1 hypothetical protein TRIADDRAFT_54358 [Trichoplax adhaerens]|eukprot:XP_002110402.1 hypothetical protein TRIADDRAFT_54358 [Trichoplax adhaerens]